MPRLPTSLLLRAYQENPLLPLLLKECRSLESARNELRWLRECALRNTRQAQGTRTRTGWRTRLRAMCHRRSQGMPLQYILGDQPFGDLEILCRRGVLIPRSDTESYTYEAARLIREIALETGDSSTPSQCLSSKPAPKPLRILDLCTGTGCIALLLHALLSQHFPRLQITGVDLSPVALSLARKNLAHNINLDVLSPRAREEISFHRGDVLARNTNTSDSTIPGVEDLLFQTALSESDPADESETLPAIDLLISNPPYISPSDFRNGTTARSVRLFEPRIALVPPINPSPSLNVNASASASAGDIFYKRLLELSLAVRARLTVLECGDKKQAERVVEMFRSMSEALGRKDGGVTFTAQIWPATEEECRANGFHVVDGSRCVVIRRGMPF